MTSREAFIKSAREMLDRMRKKKTEPSPKGLVLNMHDQGSMSHHSKEHSRDLNLDQLNVLNSIEQTR